MGGTGEASLAFFFGEAALFDLGEIDGELILPITEHFRLSLSIELFTSSQPTFADGCLRSPVIVVRCFWMNSS